MVRVGLGLVAACALFGAACDEDDRWSPRSAPLSDAAAGSGGFAAQGGAAGAGESGGTGGSFEPRCITLDDGAEVLADNLTGVGEAHVDATHLYFPFHAGGPDPYVIRIYKRALEVNVPLEEIHTGSGFVIGFALGEAHVWWAQRPIVDLPLYPDPSPWKLSRMAKTGGSVETVLPGYVEAISPSPQGLVVKRASASPSPPTLYGTFQLLPWSGGSPTDICDHGSVDAFAANATLVAWVHYSGVETCPLAGGPRTTISTRTRQGSPNALAVDATHAFWTTIDAAYRVPLAGGDPEAISAHGGGYTLVLVDDELVYQSGSRILAVPKAGGEPREVVPHQAGGIVFFTASSTHVYWGEGDFITCLKRRRLWES
jgi:hypothetical protein